MITAFIRVKNEEQFLEECVESIVDFFDKILIIHNLSSDNTPVVMNKLFLKYPSKITLIDYPHPVVQAGEGYKDRCKGQPKEHLLETYYNFCLKHIFTEYACKWDADMIAKPELMLIKDIYDTGDIFMFDGEDATGEHTTDLEPRIFKTKLCKYIGADKYEVLNYPADSTSYSTTYKLYTHMKLLKEVN